MPLFRRIRRPLVRTARCLGLVPSRREDPYDRRFDSLEVSPAVAAAAERMRGTLHPPAVWILGVMPRSGTVYTGELIRLHPQVYAYPNQMWELPLPELSGDLLQAQERFFALFEHNRERMARHDFLRLSGGAFMAYLLGFVPDGRTALFKVPDVRYLRHFETWFPGERLLLLLRDGRDVVASTLKTWPQKSFRRVAQQWSRATHLALDYATYRERRGDPVPVWKYEDIVRDPHAFARWACDAYDLPPDRYPWDEIDRLPLRGASSVHAPGTVTWEPVSLAERPRTTGKWVSWTRRQKRVFQAIAGDALQRAGYVTGASW